MGRGSYDLFSSYSHFLPGMRGMIMLFIMFLLGALLGNLAVLGLQAGFGESFTSDYGTLISYPIMFIPPMLYASVKSRLNEHITPAVPLDKGGFGKKGWTLLAATGIFSTMALAYIVEPAAALLPEMPSWLKDTFKQMLENMPVWATLLSVSVFAPLFEEWLCRGLILRGLLRSMNPTCAIAVSAVFFAVLHMNPWQAIPAFVLGVLFGYVYYKTGSLKLTILMHCANNTLAVCMSKVPQFKDAETLMDVLSPWAYWSIYALCILIVISSVAVIRTIKTSDHKTA